MTPILYTSSNNWLIGSFSVFRPELTLVPLICRRKAWRRLRMLQWERLLNAKRRKSAVPVAAFNSKKSMRQEDSRETRTEIERDHDRILFSTPVRRLGDKTQVFPLERNDSVRNRLTHSHEVSNLARSIGTHLVFNKLLASKIRNSVRDIPALLAATGLAHDLGNPPFGHQGETAIQKWFSDHKAVLNPLRSRAQQLDFLHFEGNAQTFRLVTKLQLINDNYGLDLTYATLAALMKYSVPSNKFDSKSKFAGRKKYGFFQSEASIASEIWRQTGLGEGIRHPLTYVMEACDDIAYSVLDAEDAVKKGLVSFHDLMAFLEHGSNNESFTAKVCKDSKGKSIKYRESKLTPAELNDVSMQRFRVFAIGAMVVAVGKSFIKNQNKILSGTFEGDLLGNSDAAAFCKSLKAFDKAHAYRNRAVLEIELQGYNVIRKLMDHLWAAISEPRVKDIDADRASPLNNYIFNRISENYRRVATDSSNTMSRRYKELQLMTDMISGMTDSFAVTFCNEIRKYA